jgi:hypothetical protein
MQWVPTVYYKVMINGDPLSPYPSIHPSTRCSFTLLVIFAESKPHGGIKIKGACPSLSYIMFADDTFLFGKACMGEATCIMQALQVYSQASGKELTPFQKQCYFGANTHRRGPKVNFSIT